MRMFPAGRQFNIAIKETRGDDTNLDVLGEETALEDLLERHDHSGKGGRGPCCQRGLVARHTGEHQLDL